MKQKIITFLVISILSGLSFFLAQVAINRIMDIEYPENYRRLDCQDGEDYVQIVKNGKLVTEYCE